MLLCAVPFLLCARLLRLRLRLLQLPLLREGAGDEMIRFPFSSLVLVRRLLSLSAALYWTVSPFEAVIVVVIERRKDQFCTVGSLRLCCNGMDGTLWWLVVPFSSTEETFSLPVFTSLAGFIILAVAPA